MKSRRFWVGKNVCKRIYYSERIITNYIDTKMGKTVYKMLDNGMYFGEIKGVRGVWANAKTLEACREELREVLEDWD